MPSVVITGASTGIGRAAALWMASRGWTVYAGVRKDADGLALGPTVKPVLLDVIAPDTIASVMRQVDAEVGDAGLDGLVNNAGVGGGGPLETIDLDELRRILDVNLFGAIRTTQAFLPLLRRGTPGRIVNVSSIGGRWAGPFLGPYHMSKWALEAYSDSLRMELHPHGIPVSVVEPGTIATEIWKKGDETIRQYVEGIDPNTEALYGDALRRHAKVIAGQTRQGVHPDAVARVIDHALTARRPKTRYLVGPDARLTATLRWLLPDRWFEAVIRAALSRR